MEIKTLITDWRMRDIWNEATLRPDRELKPRDYLWASELSKPLVDRYLAMKGTKPSNPPNARSRRKFLMGNIIEEMQGIIISTLGLRIDKQMEVWTHGVIPVKGKIDFLIQGVPDYERARKQIKSLGFSDEFINYLLSVVDKFEEKIGDSELAPMIRECKSCSEYVMNMLQDGGEIIGHKLQLFHYLKGTDIPLGYVDYISKGDSLMADCRVERGDKELEEKYNADIAELKTYLDSDTQPPPAPLIVFEGGFKKNFNIEYSNYLTLVYGFKEPEDYRNSVSGKVSAWNRVLARLRKVESGELTPTGRKIELTANNKAILAEMEKEGYNPGELAKELIQIEEDENETKILINQ